MRIDLLTIHGDLNAQKFIQRKRNPTRKSNV